MRKLSAIGLILIFVFTGSGTKWLVDEHGDPHISPEVTKFAANTLGFSVGIAAARQPDWIDTTLRNVYTLATEGQFDVPMLNDLINGLHRSDDIAVRALSNRILTMVELLGGLVNNRRILHVDRLDPELMKAMADGYVEGYDLAKEQ